MIVVSTVYCKPLFFQTGTNENTELMYLGYFLWNIDIILGVRLYIA